MAAEERLASVPTSVGTATCFHGFFYRVGDLRSIGHFTPMNGGSDATHQLRRIKIHVIVRAGMSNLTLNHRAAPFRDAFPRVMEEFCQTAILLRKRVQSLLQGVNPLQSPGRTIVRYFSKDVEGRLAYFESLFSSCVYFFEINLCHPLRYRYAKFIQPCFVTS